MSQDSPAGMAMGHGEDDQGLNPDSGNRLFWLQSVQTD
jgi:hypothetical protein